MRLFQPPMDLKPALQVNHFKPHLLILDIMMPDIKGYEVCKKIKENPDTAKIQR